MKQQVRIRVLYNEEIQNGWFNDLDPACGEIAIAETEHGNEAVRVLGCQKPINDGSIPKSALRLVRIADEDDQAQLDALRAEDERAYALCKEKIAKHRLPMKLVRAWNFMDGGKILFHFTSENRVDFRNLVKELASLFHKRIELRQIGVRDEAQIVGGCGVCGRELCCHCNKAMIQPVSIKMAKEQNLTLNSTKISGVCGRLLCCLGYEYAAYHEIMKAYPRTGTKVWQGDRKGVVRDINIQTGMVKIVFEDHQVIDVPNDRIQANALTSKRQLLQDPEG